MRQKFRGTKDVFVERYGLKGKEGEYAFRGGGVPIRVEGVEGVVGVVVVVGLTQEEDHSVVVEGLMDCKLEMAKSGGFFGI